MLIEILCAILLIFIWIFIEFQEWPSIRVMKMMRKIPGPPETIFFGHGLTLRKVKYEDLLGFFGSWCKEYGPIFKIWRIGIPCVILTEPEDIETLLSSTVHIKKGLVYERLKNWLGEGLLISKGLKWKYRRRILTPAFHFKILEDCISGFQNDSQLLIQELLETSGNIIEVEPFISKFTLRVLCETAMGLKLDQLPDCGNQYRDGIKHMNRTMIRRIMSPFYRVDWFFNLSPFGREQAKVVEVLHSFTDTVIEERKRLIKSDTDKSSIKKTGHHKQLNTFLDCLIELSEQEPDLLSPNDIREEVDTFMFEGHDTTSAAITAVIFMIGHHPEIQEKVVEEIINVFGKSSINTTKNELNKLKYLECVIKETLRLFPSVPTILRNLESDLSLRNGKYIIPQSCNVMIFPYWLHRNPDTFPQPELFIPERFMLDESCSRHPYSYIPFSGGPRNCIGQRFALIEMKIVLATILQKAKIVSISKLNDIKFGTGLILRPLSPFKVQITPRQLNI